MNDTPTAGTPKAIPFFGYETWPAWQSHKIVRALPICQIDEEDLVNAEGEPITDDNGRPLRKKTIWVGHNPDETRDGNLGTYRPERFKPTKLAMEDEAKVGGWAIAYADGFRSISPRPAFVDDYDRLPEHLVAMAMAAKGRLPQESSPPATDDTKGAEDTKPNAPPAFDKTVTLLRGKDNPEGWDIDELLVKIRAELEGKIIILERTKHPMATASRIANKRMVQFMTQAASYWSKGREMLNNPPA